MEAERLQTLQLATAYESMSSSLAFKELMAWLEDSVDAVEMQAANALPESNQHFQDYFTLWQQRKKVLNGIKIHVSEYIAVKNDIEEELRHEREPNDLGSHDSSSTSIRGY